MVGRCAKVAIPDKHLDSIGTCVEFSLLIQVEREPECHSIADPVCKGPARQLCLKGLHVGHSIVEVKGHSLYRGPQCCPQISAYTQAPASCF